MYFGSMRSTPGLLNEMQRSYAKAIVKHPEEEFGAILDEQLKQEGI